MVRQGRKMVCFFLANIGVAFVIKLNHRLYFTPSSLLLFHSLVLCMTPCLVFHLKGYIFSTFIFLKKLFVLQKLRKYQMQLSLNLITLKLSTVFNKCPSPSPCRRPSFLTLASMFLSYSSCLEGLRSALNVCWRLEGRFSSYTEIIDYQTATWYLISSP